MAAVFTTEQVLEQLFNDEEVSEEEEEVVVEEGDSEKEKLRDHLAKFVPNKDGFDQEFFIDKSMDVLLPILEQSKSQTRSDGKISFFFLLSNQYFQLL